MTVCIILAGGTSSRFREMGELKQFLKLKDTPLVMYALDPFESYEGIDGIIIVAAEERFGELNMLLRQRGVTKFLAYAPPGATRQHSIMNGLIAAEKYAPDYVIIHDAARPILFPKDVGDCLRAAFAEGYDGATPVLPVKETVYRSADGKSITGLLNRDELVLGQTPECYSFAKYIAAHRALSDGEIGAIRGSSEIAFKAGMKIHVYYGNPMNVKVTNMVDFITIRDNMESSVGAEENV